MGILAGSPDRIDHCVGHLVAIGESDDDDVDVAREGPPFPRYLAAQDPPMNACSTLWVPQGLAPKLTLTVPRVRSFELLAHRHPHGASLLGRRSEVGHVRQARGDLNTINLGGSVFEG